MSIGVYFDIDGTLVSSTADEDELVSTAERFGLTIGENAVHTHDQLVAQYYRRNISDGYQRATAVWCEHYGFEIDPTAFTRELKREKIETTRLANDSETVLTALAETDEIQTGIITNGAGDIQRAKLERYDLEGFFDPILISGELMTMKPKNKMFQLAAEMLTAEQHVYVADALAFDIIPAQENGFVGVLIAEDGSPVADITVASITDLTPETLQTRL